MHTNGWRLVGLEDGSSSSSDPEEQVLMELGFVNLLGLVSSQGKRGHYPGLPSLFGSPLRTRALGPTCEAMPHLLAVRGR